MAKEETLKDVPKDKVGEVIQRFMSDGANNIQLVMNANGKWDITARFS